MSKKVILLFGGSSEERLVSVASAQNLAAQYTFSELIFQDQKEALYKVSSEELFAHQNVFVSEFKPKEKSFAANLQAAVDFLKDKTVFMGFHGSQGENGEVQSLFESHRIAFTGSGSAASRTAFEKNLGKDVMSNTGHLMAEEIKFNISDIAGTVPKFEKFFQKHKKIVIKPTSSGSSFGLHIVESQEHLAKVLEEIKTSQFPVYLMENFIKGRELTVGVTQIGNDLVALPASEVVVNEGRSFDYNGKYLGTGTKEITPAQLSDTELAAAQKLAVEAHLAFHCYGYSRTDMILAAEGPYFLETNTLPGLSKPSFIPQQLLAADIPVKNFIEEQIKLAECRYEAQEV
ncbi:MAG: D-alanine--D-alanine ligase [Pseudobdellovibrio sp.]|jgi:D-alanine-D-alanine ligase|nr:D-alanine--D-alanine ligase [Pseudobdellovibrio sp.]